MLYSTLFIRQLPFEIYTGLALSVRLCGKLTLDNLIKLAKIARNTLFYYHFFYISTPFRCVNFYNTITTYSKFSVEKSPNTIANNSTVVNIISCANLYFLTNYAIFGTWVFSGFSANTMFQNGQTESAQTSPILTIKFFHKLPPLKCAFKIIKLCKKR